MSVAEFLDWNPEDGRRWQLVDGQPEAMAPANAGHAYLSRPNLGRSSATTCGLPCDVFANPGVVPTTMAAHILCACPISIICACPISR
jgi:hypothetical protein